MALSENDWARLDRMRSEDRDHLDAVTEKLDADSVRQWKALTQLNTEFQVHKSESAGVHQQPCATAVAAMKDHTDKSMAHNPKVAIPFIASVAALAGTFGAWVLKLIHAKVEVKP